MTTFRPSKRKDNNPNYKQDRAKLNELFDKARKSKPEYFNELANELKNKGKVKRIFEYVEKYINGICTVADVKKAFTKRRRPTPPKHSNPPGWIVKKR